MTPSESVRLRWLLNEMHVAVYGANWDGDHTYLHQVEDQAAALLGVRVIRKDQPDLVTPCQLHTLMYQQIHSLEHPTETHA